MSSQTSSSLLLLKCLERFEKQSQEMASREGLVRFFCQEVLPFIAEEATIEPLRVEWRERRDHLNQQIQDAEVHAMAETKEVFHEIKRVISSIDNERVLQQIALLDRLVVSQKQWYGPPLYQVLYDEIKQLLQLLLGAGQRDLCTKYAKLASCKKYVSRGSISELEEEVYIGEFSFAPSVVDAFTAIEDVYLNRFYDPAIVWWYFEGAIWCWSTPELYFEHVEASQHGKNHGFHFQTICYKFAWKEIAAGRDRVEAQSTPVIFTKDLFQNGLRVLINAISTHICGHKENVPPCPKEPVTTFELILDGNELWVQAMFENQMAEKFFIQAFHEEAGGEGSGVFRFVKDLFEDKREGERRANLIYKWESASKCINRIKLPKELKQAFFGKVHGATFYFRGTRVWVRDAKDLLRELRTCAQKI